MKTILTALLLATCVPCFAEPPDSSAPASEPPAKKSLNEALNRIRLEHVKALEAYVAADPKPKDYDDAMGELIARYGDVIGQFDKDDPRRVDALATQYSFMTKRTKPDLKSVCDNIVARFEIIWKGPRSTPEDMKKLHALFDQGRKDFPDLKDNWWFCFQEAKLKWPLLGEPMPIQFTAVDGTKVDVSALKGKVVLVYFWESSEGRSVDAVPILKAAYQKFHDAGFEVVGIPFDTDETALRAFIKKENIPWPQAFDSKGWDCDMAAKWGVVTLPLYFILGRDGKLTDYEFIDSSELEAKLTRLFTEPSHISVQEFESQYRMGHNQTMKDSEYLGQKDGRAYIRIRSMSILNSKKWSERIGYVELSELDQNFKDALPATEYQP